MLLQTFVGQENFKRAATKIAIFYRRVAREQEKPIHIAARDNGKGGVKSQATNRFNAGMNNVNNGQWVETTWEIEEGAYLRINIAKKEGKQITYDTLDVIIRMRKEAALTRINMHLCDHEEASRSTGYIEGRFDIIRPDQYEDLGLPFNEDYEPEEDGYLTDWEDFVTTEVLEREVSPFRPPRMEEVTTRSGKKVVMRKVKKRRNIRMSK